MPVAPNRPMRKNPDARAEEGQQGMHRARAERYRPELARVAVRVAVRVAAQRRRRVSFEESKVQFHI